MSKSPVSYNTREGINEHELPDNVTAVLNSDDTSPRIRSKLMKFFRPNQLITMVENKLNIAALKKWTTVELLCGQDLTWTEALSMIGCLTDMDNLPTYEPLERVVVSEYYNDPFGGCHREFMGYILSCGDTTCAVESSYMKTMYLDKLIRLVTDKRIKYMMLQSLDIYGEPNRADTYLPGGDIDYDSSHTLNNSRYSEKVVMRSPHCHNGKVINSKRIMGLGYHKIDEFTELLENDKIILSSNIYDVYIPHGTGKCNSTYKLAGVIADKLATSDSEVMIYSDLSCSEFVEQVKEDINKVSGNVSYRCVYKWHVAIDAITNPVNKRHQSCVLIIQPCDGSMTELTEYYKSFASLDIPLIMVKQSPRP